MLLDRPLRNIRWLSRMLLYQRLRCDAGRLLDRLRRLFGVRVPISDRREHDMLQ